MNKFTIEQYQNLNNSFKYELIFHIGADAGFYSEFNNMILAILYCLQYNIKFSLYSSDANFRDKNGWTDYFIPFCYENKDSFHSKYNRRYEDPFFVNQGIDRLKVLYWRMCHAQTYLTSDLFYKFRNVDFSRKCFDVPELGANGGVRELGGYMVNLIYRFNKKTKNQIALMIDELSLPRKYVGFHIRSGDKFVEHKLEQCAAYIHKAEKLTDLRKAFVLTDDYSIYESLNKDFPYWEFFTLTKLNEKGYYHQQFLAKNNVERRQELIKLFSAMEILRKSELFVGTFSSNPGMFLGMCMENAYGVDFDNWLLW